MPGLWDDLLTTAASIAGKWGSFTAFGTFLVYFLGYLALRFQLSTYGVATNLDVWDERYLFAGSRFLVYLVSSVPNDVLILIVLWTLFFLLSRLFPSQWRNHIAVSLQAWANKPNSVPLLGTLLAVALIQFVMRQCFFLGNLLLQPRQALLQVGWIQKILLTDDGNRSLYFSGLVGGVLLTGALLLFAIRPNAAATPVSRAFVGLLAFLVAVQFLLLPVNYGILIASQQLPRVSELPSSEKISPGQQAWLVWESKEASVYFRRDAADQRTLVTFPKSDGKTSIVAYDAIFRVLFGSAPGGS